LTSSLTVPSSLTIAIRKTEERTFNWKNLYKKVRVFKKTTRWIFEKIFFHENKR
jgi:hypothetical protein